MSIYTRYLDEVKRMAGYYAGIPLVEPIARVGDWVIVLPESVSSIEVYLSIIHAKPVSKFYLAEVISTPIETIQLGGYRTPEYYQWFNHQKDKKYFTVRKLGQRETQSVASDQIHNITVHR